MNLHLAHMMKIIMQIIFLLFYFFIIIFECAPHKGVSTSPAHVHEACGLPEVGTTCIMT
jgi:hypothetical protein